MHPFQQHRSLYVFESIILILLGLVAITVPWVFTLSIELLVGAIFVAGGLFQGLRALKTSHGSSLFFTLLASLAAIVAGALLLFYPLTGALTLTLLLAAFFFVDGIATTALALRFRPTKGWGWLLFSGLVGILLAAIIWSELPGSAAWVIGLLVGVNLLIYGLSQLILTLSPHE